MTESEAYEKGLQDGLKNGCLMHDKIIEKQNQIIAISVGAIENVVGTQVISAITFRESLAFLANELQAIKDLVK